MFRLAFLIGLYSYSIFFLGIFGLLYKTYIVAITLIFFAFGLFLFRKFQIKFALSKNKLFIAVLIVIVIQAFINLIGVLGPELGFDATWYHLTLPKLYLLNHKVFYIPGGLLYYSAMPKLTEMLYAAAIAMHSEIFAKFIHFSFGMLTCIALYKLSRKFLSPLFSIISVAIFYSNLVVGFESITAYVDLTRTFFEVMSLWALINWHMQKKEKWVFISSLLLGLAITVKVLAIGSLFIALTLILLTGLKKKEKLGKILKRVVIYVLLTFVVPFPWFIFSYSNTGNPFFPFFSKTYQVGFSAQLFNPVAFLKEIFLLFTRSADPISPVYIAILPLVIFFWKKLAKIRLPLWYSSLALLVWFFTPRTGGGRFILPYLPALSIVSSAVLETYKKTIIQKTLIAFVFIIISISILYRGVANAKFIPVLLEKETKTQFLENHLNFYFGDFVDSDGFFAKYIMPTDKVLLFGFHNLYYVDFPFVDSSWLRKTDTYNYIAVQNRNLLPIFKGFHIVYQNKKTLVTLYAKDKQ